MDWSAVLVNLRPGEEWTLEDCSDLGTLRWVSNTTPPTREELKAHLAVLRERQAAGDADAMGYVKGRAEFTGKVLTRKEVQDLAEADREALSKVRERG